MRNTLKVNLKKLIACSSLLLAIVSCKKDASESADRLTSGTNAPLQGLLPLEDSKKTLFVIDTKSAISAHYLYKVTGLTTIPTKSVLFVATNGYYINELCTGAGINNAYIIYQSNKEVSINEGIWNVTVDGVKKRIVQTGDNIDELDVDRINKKIYWGKSFGDNNMEIWRCNLDGSAKEHVVIGFNPVFKVGRFAVDGVGKRIYYQHIYNGKAVVGSCDLTGGAMIDVVATNSELDISQPITLDVNNHKLFIRSKFIIKSADMNLKNQVMQNAVSTNYVYGGLDYDFAKSTLYFSNSSFSNQTIFSSDFKGLNQKAVLSSAFSYINEIAGVFTY